MSWSRQRVSIPVAHRGYSSRAPENTLAAFGEAAEVGATHVECDVRLSVEGTPYVFHDPDLERIAGHRRAIASLTDAELDACDAGLWKHPRYRGEGVPTLRRTLEFLRERELNVAVELKVAGMEDRVMDVIRSTAYPLGNVTLFAFDRASLVRALQREPELHCTYLVETISDDHAWRRACKKARDAQCRAVGPGVGALTEHRVDIAHDEGLAVFVWTVDDAATLARLARWGVDAIMSNDIELAITALSNIGQDGDKSFLDV